MLRQAELVLRLLIIAIHLATASSQRLIPFFWDSSSVEDGLTYYVNYCGNSGDMIPEKDCFPCSEGQFCRLYGTCCYDWEKRYVHEIFDRAMDSFLYSQRSARREKGPDFSAFKCLSLDRTSRFVVDTCSKEETNETRIALCNDTNTVIGYTPYTQVDTGLTFRNMHCARCNGYAPRMNKDCDDRDLPPNTLYPSIESELNSSFVSWNLETICNHYQLMYTITSEDEFLSAARASRLCNVHLDLPFHAKMPERCSPSWHDPPPFERTSCKRPDPLTLHLCLTLTAPLFRTGYSGRNLFCALCEGVTPVKIRLDTSTPVMTTRPTTMTTTTIPGMTDPPLTSRPTHSPGEPPVIPPFSLLLGGSRDLPLEELKQCSNITWLDEQGDCQPATCTPGKVLVSTGHCVSALEQVKGLGYKLGMKLTPVIENITLETGDIHVLAEQLWLRFQDIVVDSKFEFIFETIVQDNGLNDFEILQSIIMDCSLIGSDTLTRDEFEERALDRIHGEWEVPINYGQNVSFFSTRLLGLSNKQEKVQELSSMTPDRRSETIRMPKEMRHLIWEVEHLFIDLSPILICPYVEVNLTSNATAEEKLTFRYKNREIAVKNHAHVHLHDEKRLLICTKYFQRLTRQPRKFKDADPLTVVQYYLEISCSAVSVTCLVAAVLTYTLFPQLRSLPGLNNMSLCGSLAVAQTSLILTVQSDVVRAFAGSYCVVHAIVLHYSWLTSYFWMSVCCVHMFRVFTSTSTKFTSSTKLSVKKRYCHYCIYAFGCPVLVVVLTAVITWALTGGTSMGYNESTCFLDIQTSYLIIILSLLVPLCCMLVTNTVLFTLTVRTIVGVTRLQSASKLRERQSIMAYVKLSTLTGAFFLVAVVSTQLQEPLVSILICPFAALQGLFLFSSFIVNRHVASLYQQKLGCKTDHFSEETRPSDGKPGTTHTELSAETKATDIQA